MTTSERLILEAIAEKGPCTRYDLASVAGRQRKGYTKCSYPLIHRLLPRLVEAGLVALVGKSSVAASIIGHPKRPAKLLVNRAPPQVRKHSTHLYGLTFRGYVEYAAFSRIRDLATMKNHQSYLKFPLFDHLSVIERIIGLDHLDRLLLFSAISTLNETRMPSAFEEDNVLHYSSKDGSEEWVRIEDTQLTKAKQHFALTFFLQLSRIPTTDLRKVPGVPSQELIDFLKDTFREARTQCKALDIAERDLRPILQLQG